MTLPTDWQARVLSSIDTTGRATRLDADRAAIERKLARLRQLLIDGDLEQQEYRAERARLEAQLVNLAPPPEQVDAERAALLTDLHAVWEGATADERKELAGRAVEAMYCDPDKPEDVYILLKPAIRPLAAALPTCSKRVIDGA